MESPLEKFVAVLKTYRFQDSNGECLCYGWDKENCDQVEESFQCMETVVTMYCATQSCPLFMNLNQIYPHYNITANVFPMLLLAIH